MKKNLLLSTTLILLIILNSCQEKTLVHKKTYTACSGFNKTKTALEIILKEDSTFIISSRSKDLEFKTEEGYYKTLNDTTFLYSELLGRKLYLIENKYLMDESTMLMIERNKKDKKAILKTGIAYKLK